MKLLNVNIFNLVGSAFCIEAEDGNKVYDFIKQALKDRKNIKLDFMNVEMLTSAFLNNAVGQIYRDFNDEDIKNLIKVENLAEEDIILLKRVISTAKLYFKDPNRMQNSINEILGEGNEKAV
jgi:hypothetical protein